MSQTYSIACMQCRKHLWIGQAGAACRPTLYSGHPEIMDALKTFLYAHVGHHLVFRDNQIFAVEDFEEIEVTVSHETRKE